MSDPLAALSGVTIDAINTWKQNIVSDMTIEINRIVTKINDQIDSLHVVFTTLTDGTTAPNLIDSIIAFYNTKGVTMALYPPGAVPILDAEHGVWVYTLEVSLNEPLF